MENQRPVLSVIMPVYNCERYLEEAVESILNQSFSDFEFIIINDGSTDGSLKTLREFVDKDIRIRLISRETRGLVYSLNEALELAKGNFIARMDADDSSFRDRFEKQINKLNETNSDICGGHYIHINAEGKCVDATICPIKEESFDLYLSLSVPFAHGSVMFRKSFIEKYHLNYGSITTYAEDYALWIEFYANGAIFCNVDDFIYRYRSYGVSFSKTKRNEYRRDTKKLRNMFIKDNKEVLNKSLSELMRKYDHLSEREKELLILSSYSHLICNKKMLFLKVLSISTPKHLILALVRILMNKF